MKPGDRVFVRLGCGRQPAFGVLLSVDMRTGLGEVRLRQCDVLRQLRFIYPAREYTRKARENDG